MQNSRKQTKMRRKIAIDFDHTICDHPFPTPRKWWLDPPMKDSLQVITHLVERSPKEVYIFTSRPKSEWPIVTQWLYSHGFPLLRVSNVKELGIDVIVDDRSIRFEGNWQSTIKLLL